MRINRSTDYAIRLILYLSKEATTISSSKLAAALGISSRYLLQVGAKLRDADYISTSFGASGGYSLAKKPQQISLYDVITVMEGHCHNRESGSPDERETEFRILCTAYDYVGSVLEDLLKSITMDNLLTQSVNEWYLAPCLLNLGKKQ